MKKMNEQINVKKGKISIENILCLFVILCPIFDIVSFAFRQCFNTSWSPSTILRPIIPIVIFVVLFFKNKFRIKAILVGLAYAIYSVLHLYLFAFLKTEASYSGILHELQYLFNYSFVVLTLFIYTFVFVLNKNQCEKERLNKKLKKSILISITIYIVSIFISIITRTSSSTYIEGLGYKGWFESGNSVSAILLLSIFIILGMIKEKQNRIWASIIIALVGIFLTTLIGTRVGLFGFIGVIVLYVAVEIIMSFFHNVKLNKKVFIAIGAGAVLLIIAVVCLGSNTLARRKHLKEIEGNLVDNSMQTVSHISGDLLKIKEKIDKGEVQESYMQKPTQEAIVTLYNFANEHNVTNNDMRTQQLVFNFYQMKYQRNITTVLFGTGYMSQFRELVLEMEIPAFLFNFGVYGFILYFVPFLSIFIYAGVKGLKHIKLLDTEYVMLLAGLLCGFGLAFLSGYTFFSTSTALIIVVISVMLCSKIKGIKIESTKQNNMK